MYARRKGSCGGWLSITALKAERRSWRIVRQTRGIVRRTRSVSGAQRKAVRSHSGIRPYAHDGRGAAAAGPGILRRLDRERKQFDHILESGRTRMMDAVLVWLGREFRDDLTGKERSSITF